jgi:hypothetical protein
MGSVWKIMIGVEFAPVKAPKNGCLRRQLDIALYTEFVLMNRSTRRLEIAVVEDHA